MTQSLWVPGQLPGLNEIVKAAKMGGRGRVYAGQKRSFTDVVAVLARKLEPIRRARISFLWVETARRRDPDNIIAGQKFILDGLVAAGILDGDGWAYIVALSHDWVLGAGAGVHVTLTAV